MQAHDRFLPAWFDRIQSHQLTLPRFQRFVAWGHGEVSGLLTTVLRGLPSGATLILQVGEEEKFKSRTMADAPVSGEKVTEQLLDGQQRLTALWRSLHDKYDDRTYLIGFENDPSAPGTKLPYVFGQARWKKNDTRYPVWVDDNRACWERGFIPIRMLRPGDIQKQIDEWIMSAMSTDEGDQFAAFREIANVINDLRTKVREFNLPYLALPSTTPKEVALDVFIKMNTSSVRLSTYDIVVALVEEETGKSLHDHVDDLADAVPRASEYADLPALVLDTVALLQDRLPSQAGYQAIDYKRMLNEWKTVIAGIRGMVEFLEAECIFDAQRLPSSTALPVIAALWHNLPTNPDALGNARHVLRKYMWRAFLTTRYEQSSTSNALQDYRGLIRVLSEGADHSAVPVLNEEAYPLPNEVLIVQADWPKRKTILGRGLLALQLKCGAEDLADGAPATVAAITSKTQPREYHHLFPVSLLEEAGVPDATIYRATNCALITWRTNRTISNKEPIAYLEERIQKATLGEDELRRRLKTHVIPFEKLSVGYDGVHESERIGRIQQDYDSFLEARAKLLWKAARLACDGRTFEVSSVFG